MMVFCLIVLNPELNRFIMLIMLPKKINFQNQFLK